MDAAPYPTQSIYPWAYSGFPLSAPRYSPEALIALSTSTDRFELETQKPTHGRPPSSWNQTLAIHPGKFEAPDQPPPERHTTWIYWAFTSVLLPKRDHPRSLALSR